MSSSASRVRKSADFIRTNLGEDLTLERVAAHAGISAYHFHRLFKVEMGETVASYTRRARLERAEFLMRAAPDRSLTSIALDVGFSSSSEFSRVFKQAFGLPPSAWDRCSRLDPTRIMGDEDGGISQRTFPVELVRHPARRIVYVRIRGPWGGDDNLQQGYERLQTWLGRAPERPSTPELLGMSWDSDRVTSLAQVTFDLGYVVDDNDHTDLGADLETRELPSCLAAEIRCTSLPEIAQAWDHLYHRWLPASRYEPADLPAMKRFVGHPTRLDHTAWQVWCSVALQRSPPWGRR